MKREKKVSAAEETKAMPQATFVDEPVRKNSLESNDTDMFVKMTDFAAKVSGFAGTIKSEHNVADVFMEHGKGWTTVVPSNILSFISFKYHVDELKKLMMLVDLPKGAVNKVALASGNVRVFVNKDKLAELPASDAVVDKEYLKGGLIDECHRNIAVKLNLNKFPKTMLEMAASKGEFKLAEGNKVMVDLDARKFIVNRVLPTIIKEESVKGYPLSNIEISQLKTEGDYVFFALTFKNTSIADVVTVDKKNYVAANFSMPHEVFGQLTKEYLDVAAAGAKVIFVDTKSLTNQLKGTEVDMVKKTIQTNGHVVTTTPVIKIDEATSLFEKAGEKTWKNPLLGLAFGSGDTRASINPKLIHSKLGNILDGDVIEYVANGSTAILPNVKKLILASLFDGEIPSDLRVSYSSSNTGIAFAVSV